MPILHSLLSNTGARIADSLLGYVCCSFFLYFERNDCCSLPIWCNFTEKITLSVKRRYKLSSKERQKFGSSRFRGMTAVG